VEVLTGEEESIANIAALQMRKLLANRSSGRALLLKAVLAAPLNAFSSSD
jgi:hypothetical protein